MPAEINILIRYNAGSKWVYFDAVTCIFEINLLDNTILFNFILCIVMIKLIFFCIYL